MKWSLLSLILFYSLSSYAEPAEPAEELPTCQVVMLGVEYKKHDSNSSSRPVFRSQNSANDSNVHFISPTYKRDLEQKVSLENRAAYLNDSGARKYLETTQDDGFMDPQEFLDLAAQVAEDEKLPRRLNERHVKVGPVDINLDRYRLNTFQRHRIANSLIPRSLHHFDDQYHIPEIHDADYNKIKKHAVDKIDVIWIPREDNSRELMPVFYRRNFPPDLPTGFRTEDLPDDMWVVPKIKSYEEALAWAEANGVQEEVTENNWQRIDFSTYKLKPRDFVTAVKLVVQAYYIKFRIENRNNRVFYDELLELTATSSRNRPHRTFQRRGLRSMGLVTGVVAE